jgi:hypothetical protein
MVDREPVYVGIQKGNQVIALVPGDAPRVVFDFPVDVMSSSREGLDFRGPFVHGDRGKRFLYLSWGEVGENGRFSMFRRAKLPLSAIDAKHMVRSLSSTSLVVEGTLNLTDDKEGPICGTAVARVLDWKVLT